MKIESLTNALEQHLSKKQQHMNQILENELNLHKQSLMKHFNEELNLMKEHTTKLSKNLYKPMRLSGMVGALIAILIIILLLILYLGNQTQTLYSQYQNYQELIESLPQKELSQIKLYETEKVIQLTIPESEGKLFKSQNGLLVLEISKK